MHRFFVTILLALSPLIYLLCSALGAGLLAVPLFLLVQGSISLDTLVSRGAELLMVLGLFPLGRRLGFHAPDLGLPGCRSTLARQVRSGFLLGTAMLGLHLALLLGLEARTVDHQKLELVRVLRLALKALSIGIAVACIEESVFRGFLFGCLIRKTSRTATVLITSFYFAILHFLDSDVKYTSLEIRWDSGLLMVADAFRHLFPLTKPDAFLALFAAGALLTCVRIWRPWGLGYCIGLHMGWIFVIKTAKPLTHVGEHPLIPGLISKYDGIIGYLSASWTTVLVGLLVYALARRTPLNSTGTP